MRSRLGSILCVFSLLVALAGCGGSDGGGAITPPPTSGNPRRHHLRLPPPPPPVIGVDGGTVTEASWRVGHRARGRAHHRHHHPHRAWIPPARRAIPADLTAAGNMYVDHAARRRIRRPVEVRIPAPHVTLQPNQVSQDRQGGAGRSHGWCSTTRSWPTASSAPRCTASRASQPSIVTYPLPILQADYPLQ